MSYCNQKTISDGFLDKLIDLQALDMSYCTQITISGNFIGKQMINLQ